MADPTRAGQPTRPEDLVDVPKLIAAYFDEHPDPAIPEQRVTFGTSGHRGSSLSVSFNEDHIVATSQAICEYRAREGIRGPLYLGADSHALSEPATASAIEVFAANDVTILIDSRDGYTPTPAVSRAILAHNAGRALGGSDGPADPARADGVVVTPSHNPPPDGGFKYNPPDGGPAGTDITGWIQDRANEILAAGMDGVRRLPLDRAMAAPRRPSASTSWTPTSPRCPARSTSTSIRSAGVRIGADPLGGASASRTGARSARATAWT